MRNAALAALGLLFALVAGWILWTNAGQAEGLSIAFVGLVMGAVGGYYLWLSTHPDKVPAVMRAYPWARSERGLMISGLVLFGVALALVALGDALRR
jgi:hypothetical protein